MTLNIVDRYPMADYGTFQSWQIIVYGQLSTPTLYTPADNAAPTTALPFGTVNLTWRNSSTVTRYELQVDSVNPPASTPISINAPTTQKMVTLPYGTHYWRVRSVASDGNGGEMFSNWSPVRSFTLTSTANTAPILNSEQTPTPTFTWNRVVNAVRYELRVNTNAAMSGTPVLSVTDIAAIATSYTPVSSLAAGVYYWQVRACTSATVCGAWSSIVPLVILNP